MRKVFFFLLFIILVFFHFRGINYYDEGYILNAALRVAHGQVPYRDFDMVYTPLSFVITAGFFKIFGVSVFVGRVVALLISLASIYALYRILTLFIKNFVLIAISLLFFMSWGPTHINFPWPTMFSVCFFLYTLLFYLLGILQKNKKYFFLAGIMTMVLFLTKQNFGVGIFLVSLISFLSFPIKNKKEFFMTYLFGFISAVVVYLISLLSTNSLMPLIDNFYVYTFKRILVIKSLDTPFIYFGSWLERFAKFLFYTLPFSVSAIAFFTIRKFKKSLLAIPFFVATFYLFGIRPTTDYNHLVPLLALTSLPLALVISFAKNNILQRATIVFLLGMTVLGFYTAYYKGYYKWDPPLRNNTFFVQDERLHLFLHKQNADELTKLMQVVQENKQDNKYIFVNYYAPLLYVLTTSENPTRYDFVSSSELPQSYQKDIVSQLKKKNVQVIITHVLNKNENALVSNYIRKNYHIAYTIGAWIIFLK